MNFSELGLSPEVLKAIEEAGYTEPTPIQEKAIPYVLMSRDVLGCAQTGTGKTASFTVPMIEILATTRTRARMRVGMEKSYSARTIPTKIFRPHCARDPR